MIHALRGVVAIDLLDILKQGARVAVVTVPIGLASGCAAIQKTTDLTDSEISDVIDAPATRMSGLSPDSSQVPDISITTDTLTTLSPQKISLKDKLLQEIAQTNEKIMASTNTYGSNDVIINIDVALDRQSRRVFGERWEQKIYAIMQEYEKIFNKINFPSNGTGVEPQIRFRVSGFYYLSHNTNNDLDVLKKLKDSLPARAGHRVIGFVGGDLYSGKLRKDYSTLGRVDDVPGKYCVIECKDGKMPDIVLIVVHELAHSYGATHVDKKDSIMYPEETEKRPTGFNRRAEQEIRAEISSAYRMNSPSSHQYRRDLGENRRKFTRR